MYNNFHASDLSAELQLPFLFLQNQVTQDYLSAGLAAILNYQTLEQIHFT